jgi:hypothetical protein
MSGSLKSHHPMIRKQFPGLFILGKNALWVGVIFRIVCPDFRNYLSSLRFVKKLDKSQEFIYVDFLPSFLPRILTLRSTFYFSL